MNSDPTRTAAASACFEDRYVELGDYMLHAVVGGPATSSSAPTLIFLHGWPEDWTEWRGVMGQAVARYRVVAFDLPGVGGSRPGVPTGEKAAIAEVVVRAVAALGIERYILIGHDVGTMIAFACARQAPAGLRGVALVSSVIPGIEPWSKVIANPHIWHFAFHAIPDLPEQLVAGKQQRYFDYFFNLLAKTPSTIGPAARAHYAEAYQRAESLQAGFDWYRALPRDAEINRLKSGPVLVPILCIRGEAEIGLLDEYVAGLFEAGCINVSGALLAHSGHFGPEENPAALWHALQTFAAQLTESATPRLAAQSR